MSDIALQWTLNETAKDSVGISKELLRALTADNVQALAFLASERYGTLVSMSQESCQKVFALCDRTHESAMLGFLKAGIGYVEGDCGHQLSRSDAGLRFLGLAACLSTLTPWDAALVLHKLIYDSAQDKMLVPTNEHLKQLMQVLQYRLARSKFCESILGCAKFFDDEMEISGDRENYDFFDDVDSARAPTVESIAALTAALSRVARIGESNHRVKVITPADMAAWFVAFIKWCLGARPAVILFGVRTIQSDLPVTVELVKNETDVQQKVRIEVYDSTRKLIDSVGFVSPYLPFRGLVSVGTYGQLMLRLRFGDSNSLLYRACLQLLPYACALVRQKIIISRSWSAQKLPESLKARAVPGSTATLGQVFPPLEKIDRTIHDYIELGADRTPLYVPLTDELAIKDLPLVSLARSSLKQSCRCGPCHGREEVFSRNCKVVKFFHDISDCVAEIMILSLFHPLSPDGVQVYFGFCQIYPNLFNQCIFRILSKEVKYGEGLAWGPCMIRDILQMATAMMGHEVEDGKEWVVSSKHDQTIYPQLLETYSVQSEGILSLQCVPGTLMWGNQHFARVYVSTGQRGWNRYSTPDQKVYVQRELPVYPRNDFPSYRLVWEVEMRDTALYVLVTIPKFSTNPGRDPTRLLEAAVESLFVNCIHDRASMFTSHNGKLLEMSPLEWSLFDPFPRFEDPESIGIIQTDNNEQVRFFCLTSGEPAVIRQNACLECCVKHCQLASKKYVIC